MPKSKSKQKYAVTKVTSKPIPLTIIKQIRALIKRVKPYEEIKYQMDIEKQLQTVRAIGQINKLLDLLPIQFVPHTIMEQELNFFMKMFTRISSHKEICVCLILRVLEASFYASIGKKPTKNDGQAQKSSLSEQVSEFINLCELCLMFNNEKPVIFNVVIEALQKIRSWCSLAAQFDNLCLKIDQIIKQSQL